MQLVVWLSVVLSVLYSQGTGACPDKCSCSRSPYCNGTDVNCYGIGLSVVPGNIPTDTCNIRLSNNKIRTIPAGIFDNLVNLRELSLGSNYITTLPDGIFDNLVNLRELHLSYNGIKTLPNRTFDALVNLQKLSLDKNKIRSLPDGIFDTLLNLTELRLKGNQITTLPDGIFKALVNLRILYLNGNRITALQHEIFGGLLKLYSITIENNPLRCDCEMFAFMRFAKTRQLQLEPYWKGEEPSCQNPLSLKEILLKDFILQDIVCDPVSTTGSDLNTTSAVTNVTSSNYSFTTTDASTARPVITVTGTKNTKVTVPGDPSELLSIQKEMLELTRQDIAIKRDILQTFKAFVARKTKKNRKKGKKLL